MVIRMLSEEEIRTRDIAFIKSVEELIKQLIKRIEEEAKDSEESRLNHYLTLIKIFLSQVFDKANIEIKGSYRGKEFRYNDYIDETWFHSWMAIQGWKTDKEMIFGSLNKEELIKIVKEKVKNVELVFDRNDRISFKLPDSLTRAEVEAIVAELNAYLTNYGILANPFGVEWRRGFHIKKRVI
jgi:predicted metal-dependent hydrolase